LVDGSVGVAGGGAGEGAVFLQQYSVRSIPCLAVSRQPNPSCCPLPPPTPHPPPPPHSPINSLYANRSEWLKCYYSSLAASRQPAVTLCTKMLLFPSHTFMLVSSK
jgi:hypothetical protein